MDKLGLTTLMPTIEDRKEVEMNFLVEAVKAVVEVYVELVEAVVKMVVRE